MVATAAHAQTDTTAVDSTLVLGGVTVSAARRLVTQDIDKLSYDVAHDEEAKTNNVLEMLRKVPMVTVDGQDNILVNGSSSFKIYRNGHHDPSLSGSNASQILKAMPANTIKRVEVITEPGAKYDAEGTTAILNIVMKDNAGMTGVAGTVNMGTDTDGTLQPGLNLTAQTGRLTFSVDYGYMWSSKDATESHSNSETRYRESGQTLLNHSSQDGPVQLHWGNLSASYEIDSLNLLSATGGGWYVRPDIDGTSSTTMVAADGQSLYAYDQAFSTPRYNRYSISGRADFQHKTRLDGEVMTL